MLSGIAGEIGFLGTRTNTAPVEHMINTLTADTGSVPQRLAQRLGRAWPNTA